MPVTERHDHDCTHARQEPVWIETGLWIARHPRHRALVAEIKPVKQAATSRGLLRGREADEGEAEIESGATDRLPCLPAHMPLPDLSC